MTDCKWCPSKTKYGVAICNYPGKEEGTLTLDVGETVHILEVYGTGKTAWYRGTSFKNKEKMGIFPACLIHIKPCEVSNEGLYETITPLEDIMAKEVIYVLREWAAIWKDLFVTPNNRSMFDNIAQSMMELTGLRGLLIYKKLSQEEIGDVKRDIVDVIDWGNGQLGMDLVPRIDGEQVDADLCSITQLHRVHADSAHTAGEGKPKRRRKTQKVSKADIATDLGINTHHILASFKNFGCNVGDISETLLSLYHYKDNKCVCLTEKFVVKHNKMSMPEDIERLNNYYGLFTDLTNEDLEKDLYLVAHIFRVGRMIPDNSKKAPSVVFKRPWGVGVEKLLKSELVNLNLSRLPSNFRDWEFQMKVTIAETENEFPTLHEKVIRRITSGAGNTPSSSVTKLGLSLSISVQVLHGDLATIKKEDPMLFSKGVALVQKLGFSEVITPGEVRNDLYVTMRSAEFDRGNKKAQKNVEVRVTVYDANLNQIKNCITYGCGDTPTSEYLTAVYYHNNKPEWDETIRISVPIDTFPGSHICFQLYHCSVKKKEVKKQYGFAFIRLTNEAQIVIKDADHELIVYHLDEKHKLDIKKYISLPFLSDDLNDPQMISKIPNNLMFRANEKESLVIKTLLCSGKLTSNSDLLGILNWRGPQFKDKLSENLDKLSKMQGDELVKFLHDILDGLFDMLSAESETHKLSTKIFKSLVYIFTVIHHARFETFKPVLEAYISETFSAPLVHKLLCRCFSDMISNACRTSDTTSTNMQLIQVFQSLDYIFRFIVQSRQLQMKNVYSRSSGDAREFQENIRSLFESMSVLLSSTSGKLQTYQVALLNSLHMSYPPLLKLLPEKDLIELLEICINNMPPVKELPEDVTRVKLELLRKTVNTTLFTNDASRTILLPICLHEVKMGLEGKVLIRLTVDLLGDTLDNIFKLKQRSAVSEDIQKLVSSLFDPIVDAILDFRPGKPMSTTQVRQRVEKTKTRKPTARTQSQTPYTMRHEAKITRKTSVISPPSVGSPKPNRVPSIEITRESLAPEKDENDNVFEEEIIQSEVGLFSPSNIFQKFTRWNQKDTLQVDLGRRRSLSPVSRSRSPSPGQPAKVKGQPEIIQHFNVEEREYPPRPITPNKQTATQRTPSHSRNMPTSPKAVFQSQSHQITPATTSQTHLHPPLTPLPDLFIKKNNYLVYFGIVEDSDCNGPYFLAQSGQPKGVLIACLTEILRLMEEEHYTALLHVYHRGPPLKDFLNNILRVFYMLVQPKVFPKDWTVMRMVTNNVVFTAVEYFSQALKDNYIAGDKFDVELWRRYFNLAVAFIVQPSLQLDKYSEAKAQKLKERYQDMRVLMGVQVETLWQSLGRQKEVFIPSMIGPFLELTMVPEREVRKATLPIIFDMMESEQRKTGNFKLVEATLIERLDFFLTQQCVGDTEYKELFQKILLDRVQSEPNLSENGPQFIISVTHLLERLLDYRQVIEGDENRDKRMHCTFNILNFYKDEINREEMYIRYVNKLHELHLVAGNHTEAGKTLELYAKVLNWSDNLLPKEMRYKEEKECDRKEMLYTEIINCFDKGKVWEYAIPLCKDLAKYYEGKLDYKKLGDILKQQASFYQKILEGVPGEDPSQPDAFFPRQDPSYYRVSYYGQSFPAFVRNKQFIYRGDECLKLATIINHLTAEFPAAQIIPNNHPQNENIKDGDQQFIQICSVKPIANDRSEFRGQDVPTEIRNFYNVNEVDTFQFDRPYHRGEKDPENESKSLCIERTKMRTVYKFPGILRWYEVIAWEVEKLCPIQVAIETLKQYNSEFHILSSRCQLNSKLYAKQLTMRLQGIISAAVQGGITKYHEAFFTREFEVRFPHETVYLPELRALLNEQVQILSRGMKLHGNIVTDDLKPLHNSLEADFKKMRKTVQDLGGSSTPSLRSLGSTIDIARSDTPSTSSLTSGSGRSSLISQDEDMLVPPEDLPCVGEKSRRSYVPCLDDMVPPPVPCRPQSMLLSGHVPMQVTNQLYNGQTRTGSDPSLHGARSPVTPVMNANSAGNLVQRPRPERTSTFTAATKPQIEPRRRPSAPAIPSYAGDPQQPPKIPEKKRSAMNGSTDGIPEFSSHNFMGLKSPGPTPMPRTSPGSTRTSPGTTPTNDHVPPLPPRKHSTSSPMSQLRQTQPSESSSPNLGNNPRYSSVRGQTSYTRDSAQSQYGDAPPPIPRRGETQRERRNTSDSSTNL